LGQQVCGAQTLLHPISLVAVSSQPEGHARFYVIDSTFCAYDTMIDTGIMSPEACVKTVLGALIGSRQAP
jgi:hypothetical protein